MLIIYDFVLFFYTLIIQGLSLFHHKANLLIKGRNESIEKLNLLDSQLIGCFYFHVSSLGEFEQARTLIEKIRLKHPDKKIVLSFYSPSGYEVRKNYTYADLIIYLPKDSKQNAQLLWKKLQPSFIFWVKYDFWYHYLCEANQLKIPLVLICSRFSEDQVFFKWYGFLFRKILGFFDAIFVQNEHSKQLLDKINVPSEICHDTRFDRVYEISQQSISHEFLDTFIDNKKCIVFGSTWPKDEKLIFEIIDSLKDYKLIIAPHNTNEKDIYQTKKLFQQDSILYSNRNLYKNESILIIDNIGMLASVYKKACIAYIGGGFDVSVHNVLEAAVYEIPVLCGPNTQKSIEAIALKAAQSLFIIHDGKMLGEQIEKLMRNENNRKKIGLINSKYVFERLGGTEKILNYFEEKI